MAYNVLTG